MKINYVPMSKRLLGLVVIVTLTLSLTSSAFGVELNLNKGEKVNYAASTQDVVYSASGSAKEINDLYQLKWYENPQREISQAEFMLAQLRTIQASLERQHLQKYELADAVIVLDAFPDFSDSVKRELLLCRCLGMISLDYNGNFDWNIEDTISETEANTILTRVNYDFKISETPIDSNFNNSNEPILVEDMVVWLNKEVGCHGIEQSDVANAMAQTFKVTTPLNVTVAVAEEIKPAIVTDPALLPSNASRYPYILDNVTKAEYEKPFFYDRVDNTYFYSPLKLYPLKKHQMSRVKETVEGYYGFLFNVDYNTISAESYEAKMYQYCIDVDPYSRKVKINDYVNYVKANKIKIEATVQFLEPCLYCDGGGYRARIKVNYNIKESDTRKNIFFDDHGYNLYNLYNNNSNCIYLDVPLSNIPRDPNNYMYIWPSHLSYDILDKDTCGITLNVQ